ncbi:unannotated protein [freshwater metagenome]|uniref:Unannotated protein n=1 Tax=freshwater metagenome TaxID=449393 RepID=A0A6J6J8Q8_9ZZZZ|nr:DUF3027 domain-containing protein [Actinomycetota bacterium]
MPKSPALEQKNLAKSALVENAGVKNVGNFIGVTEIDKGLATFLFENNQKGYVGWRWSVTIFQDKKNQPATVSEIVLLPGDDSLVAPDWVPWSERLSDYKALQMELEKQAALDALDDESEDDAEDESAEESTNESVDESEELAVSDLEEGEDAKDDAEDTGRKPPRFLRRRKGLKIKKARGQGKNPKD